MSTDSQEPATLYKCNNYTCSTDKSGSGQGFSSLSECQDSCQPSFICKRPKKGMPSCTQTQNLNNQLKDAKSQYESAMSQASQAEALATSSSKSGQLVAAASANTNKDFYNSQAQFFSSTISSLQDQLKSGAAANYYDTLASCESSCKPKFSCDSTSASVFPAADGKYDSLKEAQENCRDRYSCDEGNYVIMMDPNGQYKTPAEASEHCKPPLIVPKQRVSQADVDLEESMYNNIEGQLKSDSLRLESTYLHMFVWGAVMILIVYMVFYYSSHNTDSALQTLIALAFAVALIWVIAAWAWNYFSRNPIRLSSGPVIY